MKISPLYEANNHDFKPYYPGARRAVEWDGCTVAKKGHLHCQFWWFPNLIISKVAFFQTQSFPKLCFSKLICFQSGKFIKIAIDDAMLQHLYGDNWVLGTWLLRDWCSRWALLWTVKVLVSWLVAKPPGLIYYHSLAALAVVSTCLLIAMIQ